MARGVFVVENESDPVPSRQPEEGAHDGLTVGAGHTIQAACPLRTVLRHRKSLDAGSRREVEADVVVVGSITRIEDSIRLVHGGRKIVLHDELMSSMSGGVYLHAFLQ